MELWVIRHEWRDDMEAWALAHFGVLRSPGRPSIKKLGVEVGSVLLITIGVMGELGVGIKITSINGILHGKNGELRTASDRLVALLTSEAKSADLARAKIEASVAWRRLSDQQKIDVGNDLKRLHKPDVISIWYIHGDAEGSGFAADMAEALSHAKMVVFTPIGAPPSQTKENIQPGQPILRWSTGVQVEFRRGKTESIALAGAIAKELSTRGFDATAHVSKVLDTVDGPGIPPNILLLVFPRPEGPQGEFKLEAEREAKTKSKSNSSAKP